MLFMRDHQVVDCLNCGLLRLCFPGRVVTDNRQRVEQLRIRQARVATGTWLYRPGDRVRSLFTLRSGCVKEVASATTESEPVLNFCLPGEVLGLQHAGADCFTQGGIAVEATSYCEMPWQSFQQLCAESPEVGNELIGLMARAALASQELFALIRNRDALKQLAGFLLNISTRMRARGLHGKEFRLGMSRMDIANYLGLTSETVSRCFSQLARQGLIRVQAKSVQLLRPAALACVFAGESIMAAT
jgi:CRP/FNR family transcriptional regulator